MVITDELFRLADAFAKHQLEYALCGGLAVAIHGRPRLTLDIDFVVSSEDMAKAIEIAGTVGFDEASGWISLPSSNTGIDRLFRLNKFSGSDFLTLDLLEADSSENAIFKDRERIQIEGRVIQLLSRTALIQMKNNSDRTKDRLDVELLSDESDER